MNATPVAILDPDPGAHRLRMHGIAVHYAGENAPAVLRKLRADLLVVASGEELSDDQQRILESCRGAGMPIEQLDVGMREWQGLSHAATAGLSTGA